MSKPPTTKEWQAAGGMEYRTKVGRFLRWSCAPWLDALYYWFDLRRAPALGERQGFPDHNKVLSTIAFFFGLIGVGIFGINTVAMCVSVLDLVREAATPGRTPVDPDVVGQLVKSCALMTTALLGYAALVFGMAFGLSGFRVWAKTRGGGTSDALGKVAAETMNAEVAARRAQGGDYEVTQ